MREELNKLKSDYKGCSPRCKVCDGRIAIGEICYEMDGEFYHDKCFEDTAVRILLDECGAMIVQIGKERGE